MTLMPPGAEKLAGCDASCLICLQVPIIDLSQDEDTAAAQVRAACLNTGFFYGEASHQSSEVIAAPVYISPQHALFLSLPRAHLCPVKKPQIVRQAVMRKIDKGYFTHAVSNHGVDETLVERLFEENRNFFALPEEEKRRMLVDQNSRHAFSFFMLTSHC